MEEAKEMVCEINGTTYLVSTHFGNGEENVLDKINRLIQQEVENAENPII